VVLGSTVIFSEETQMQTRGMGMVVEVFTDGFVMPPAGSQQQILRTIDFWQLSRAARQQVPGPSAQLLDFLAHHPYCMAGSLPLGGL
jgi:hypothetical protein